MAFNFDSEFKAHRPTEQAWGVYDFVGDIHTYNMTFDEAVALAEELKGDFKLDYTAQPCN